MKHRTKNKKTKRGTILLFAVIVLTAIFSISLGVFSVILGQVNITLTFGSSYVALYAADQSIERTFYRDRQNHEFSNGLTTITPSVDLPSGGCIKTTTIKKASASSGDINTTGLSTPCVATAISARTVARAFRASY